MSPCDQIVIQLLADGNENTLWICDENTSRQVINQVNPNGIQTLSNRFTIDQQLSQSGFSSNLNDFDFSELSQFDKIIYRVSKERLLAQHCIEQSCLHLNESGQLVLVGEKNDGLKTHGKYAEKIFQNPVKLQKHGLAYSATISKNEASKRQETNAQSDYRQLQFIQHRGVEFYSKPGIYGWKKIDIGSQLLIDAFKQETEGKVNPELKLLDLGCGYGFLSLEAAKLGFKNIHATDNNVAAIIATAKNFESNKIETKPRLDDCGRTIIEKFDFILCNPPFHQGFDHDKSLIENFVNQSEVLLKKSGSAFFVVNEFISLARSASNCGLNAQELVHNKGFKVYKLNY